ncbi:MAG: hypothetical protein ABSE53_01560 [Terracidiphilus sp.]|jgi:hypothetical protein
MSTPRVFVCLCVLACAPFLNAQTPPTAYTITEPGGAPGSSTTIYRNGSKALMAMDQPAQGSTPASRTYNLVDIAAGTNYTWNPDDSRVGCSVGTFSGDWGDPFAMTADLSDDIAKGNLKPTGTETVDGISAQIYSGVTQGTNIKVWLDQKDGLVLRAVTNAPNAAPMTLVDITKVSFTTPPTSRFILPAACAGVKPPPTPAELIADETGDDAANWVNANYSPGSTNSCSIVVRVVAAKTMAPINRKFQAAIDTTYDQNNPTPPHYVFGVGNDGTSTYSGGGLHEITDQIRNGMLRIDNPPAYFMFGVNIPTPNHGADVGLIYRQCFAPVTMLYYVVKDPSNPADGGDWLYANSGKYAVPPTR